MSVSIWENKSIETSQRDSSHNEQYETQYIKKQYLPSIGLAIRWIHHKGTTILSTSGGEEGHADIGHVGQTILIKNVGIDGTLGLG